VPTSRFTQFSVIHVGSDLVIIIMFDVIVVVVVVVTVVFFARGASG